MREHDWEATLDNGVRRERRCRLCEVPDWSINDSPWRVRTPCIEPVPERVSYEELKAEIRLNVAHEYKHRLLVERIQCVGVPGRWRVGLAVAGDGIWPSRKEPFKDMEVGFAELLRYLRARQFDPYKYSDLRYNEQLAHHDCPFDDD